VALGDVISYYIVAQDSYSSPNVGSNPSAGASVFTINPPAAGIPPTTPNSYTIVGTICGTFNVGVGKDYPTLTAAVTDLNSKDMTCAVKFVLTDAAYPSETFPIVINANGGASSINTLTIKPGTAVTPAISGASANGPVIKILNNYTIIDGSNTTGGTTRDLTISNSSATAPQVVFIASTGTTPVTNITLMNTIIINGANTSSAVVVTDIGGATGGYFNNITLQNNRVQTAYVGMYCWAATASGNAADCLSQVMT